MKKKLEDFCKKNLIVIFFVSVLILCGLCYKATVEPPKANVASSNISNAVSGSSVSESDSGSEEVAETDSDSYEEEEAESDSEADSETDSETDADGDEKDADSDSASNENDEDSDSEVDETDDPDADSDQKDTAAATETVINPNYVENQFVIYVNRAKNFVKVCRTTPTGEELRVKTMACSVGREGHATPLGTFKTSQYYDWRLMVDNTYGRYAIRFNGHIMFHSVPYFKASPNTLEWEEYNKLGSPASLGCVRLQVADVKWIYDNCKAGTTVVVYDDYTEEDANVPAPVRIDVNSPNRDWDPSDIDPLNPWYAVALPEGA